MLFMIVPKGFFPVQDTGVILGVSRGSARRFRSRPCRERQQALAKVILEDPAVESLSSFIGIDGVNTTLNSGRIQINLKPLESARCQRQRSDSAAAAQSWRQSTASPCSCSRCRISRWKTASAARNISTRWKTPIAKELNTWTTRLVEKLRTIPTLRDVATDQQNSGLETTLVIDRDTASRLGIGMQQIDDTLYDAFGQRLVSTMFTQLNQYHVVLEVAPGFRATTRIRWTTSTSVPHRHAGAAQLVHALTSRARTPLTVNHQGQFPVVTISFNLPAGESLGNAVKAIKQAEAGDRLAAQHPFELPGHGRCLPELAGE